MGADRSTAELERFLAERAGHLLRTAVLLTGSREAGEDLLQTAVERLLRRWRRFDGDPKLTVPVPAGFRRVPLARAVRPILRQIPAGPLPEPGPLCLSQASLACAYGPGAVGFGPGHPGHFRHLVPYPAAPKSR